MLSKYIVVDEDTGEVITELGNGGIKVNLIVLAKEVDRLVNKAELLDENEFKKLFSFMRATGEINNKNQIKLNGKYTDNNRVFGLIHSSGSLASSLGKLLSETTWNNMIKKNKTSVCSDWNELCNICVVTDKNKRSKFKKFLTVNNIVKKSKCVGGFRMIVNPNIVRQGSHTSQRAILEFWNETKNDVSSYAKKYFYSNGEITEKELKN